MTVEGPAPPEESRAKAVNAAAMAGPGIGRAAGRGILLPHSFRLGLVFLDTALVDLLSE